MYRSWLYIHPLLVSEGPSEINIAAVVAEWEWLRGLTRNQFGFARASSNPANCVNLLLYAVYGL